MKTNAFPFLLSCLLWLPLPVSAVALFVEQEGIPSVEETVNSEGTPVVVPEDLAHLGGLNWVWSREPGQPYFGLRAYYLSEPEERYFRRDIEAPERPVAASITVAADAVLTVAVNGKTVAEGLGPVEAHVIDLNGAVRAGNNAFAIAADNEGDGRNPAGLIGRVRFEYADGTVDWFPIDESWQVARSAEAGWESAAPGAVWEDAVIVGPYGVGPWLAFAGPLLPPPNYPDFSSGDFERELELWREMALRYYRYGSVPTYKDFWMPESYLWVGLAEPGDYERNEVLWREALAKRHIDAEGYVSTHQHIGLGHPHGWPFPFWIQAGGAGWAFSPAGQPYLERIKLEPTDPGTWTYAGAEVLGRSDPRGAELRLTAPDATMTVTGLKLNHRLAPFVTLRWFPQEMDPAARPWLEWTTEEAPDFGGERRVYFESAGESAPQPFWRKDGQEGAEAEAEAPPAFDPAAEGDQVSLAPLYQHPEYGDTITGLRIGFDNPEAGPEIGVKLIFSTQDTRHNGNNAQFVGGVHDFVAYTGDTEFLREQMPRLRKALRFAFEEFDIPEAKRVVDPWIGHEGWAGIEYVDGVKHLRRDRGMGNNFWDLLPFGGNDFYSSMLYYEAILRMARMEELVREHPEWGLANDPDAFDPEELRELAAEMKAFANDYFWNEETGRFPANVDVDGVKHDYGFTFVNNEAIYYGFVEPERARSILEWTTGARLVEGDTAWGPDIYRWRFAPRATTKRNLDWYKFAWAAPERRPFGDQIQDGGAVMGFSFHDLMARHRVIGPDNAWERLQEILDWYEEVWEAGGYIPYYEENEGTLQSPTPGGLGLHREFTEPSLMPLYALKGFFGFAPLLDGFVLDPHFPADFEDFTLDRVRYQDALLELGFERRSFGPFYRVTVRDGSADGLRVHLPPGEWRVAWSRGGTVVAGPESFRADEAIAVDLLRAGADSLILSGQSDRAAELEGRAADWPAPAPVPDWEVGEVVHAFDFGEPGAPVAEAWTAVADEAYTRSRGYGWEQAPDLVRLRDEAPEPHLRSLVLVPDTQEGGEAVFRVDLAPGVYLLEAGFGDPDFRSSMEVYVGGEEMPWQPARYVGEGVYETRKRLVRPGPEGTLRLTIPAPPEGGVPYRSLNWLRLTELEEAGR